MSANLTKTAFPLTYARFVSTVAITGSPPTVGIGSKGGLGGIFCVVVKKRSPGAPVAPCDPVSP